MKLPVYNKEGIAVGREIELPANVFGLELNDKLQHVVYLAVKQFLANQRQGTHKSKQRNEISGSTRKLHRQKGTGGSRKGSIKNPLFHGGGRIFGPQPRDYSQQLNKKVKRLARKAVLSAKAQEGRLLIVEDFTMNAPKTKSYIGFLSALDQHANGLAAGKNLFVLNPPKSLVAPQRPRRLGLTNKEAIKAYSEQLAAYRTALAAYNAEKAAAEAKAKEQYTNIQLSARNVPNADIAQANMLNTYDILNTQYLVVSESALQQLITSLS